MFSLCVTKLSHWRVCRLALLRSLVNSVLGLPGLGRLWGQCVAGFGKLEGCLAVTGPGVGVTAVVPCSQSLFQWSRFSVLYRVRQTAEGAQAS